MADIKARYVGGSRTGVELTVPLANGETAAVHVKHGGELPTDIDGVQIPASYRDSLLEQTDQWTEVRRDTTKTATAEKDGDS